MKAIRTSVNGPTDIKLTAVERHLLDRSRPILEFIGKCADGLLGDAAATAATELDKVLELLDASPVASEPKE